MRILHLIHGLFGQNNGVDIYIRSFIKASEGIFENIIAIPSGKNEGSEDIKTEIIELNSLYELENIVNDFDIDILLIHHIGEKTFTDRTDIIKFKGNYISLENRLVYNGTLDDEPFSFSRSSMLWNPEKRKHKIFILSHACFSLPEYIKDFVNEIISVSEAAKKINDIFDNHSVIYPCLKEELEELLPEKVVNEKEIIIGWLGTLSKINSIYYDKIKTLYANNPSVKFIFAGKGQIDPEPPSNFEFVSPVDSKEFFQKIDIFFYPTSIDSFSISLLEAMSQNKLCIVSDVVKELASFGNMYIFKDTEEIEEIFRILLNNRQIIKAKNNRNIVLENFSSKKMIEKFQKVFED